MEDNFQRESLSFRTPFLVDCWASQCNTFQQINPVLSGTTVDFAGHVKFGRLDIAIAKEWAIHYKIRVVPMLLLFQEGQLIERVVGGLSKADLNRQLTRLIALKPMSRSHVFGL